MPAVLVIGLAVLLTAFVAYGMAFLQHSQSQGFLGWLANAVENLPIIGGFSIKQVLKLDSWITHYIGSHFKQVERVAVGWIAGMSVYQKLAASGAFGWPAELWALSTWVVSKAIPRGVKGHTQPIARQAAHADATAIQALRGVEDLAKAKPGSNTQLRVTRIERVAMPHAAEWDWITSHWHALTRAVTGTLPVALPHPHAPALTWPFGITPKRLLRRLRRVEGLLGVTGLAAVMAGVLRIPNPRCLSSGPIGKVARALCGLGTHALEDLLGLLVDVLLVTDICEVIRLLNEALSVIEGPLAEIVGTVEGALCHGDFAAPPKLSLPALSLPPATGLALSLP